MTTPTGDESATKGRTGLGTTLRDFDRELIRLEAENQRLRNALKGMERSASIQGWATSSSPHCQTSINAARHALAASDEDGEP